MSSFRLKAGQLEQLRGLMPDCDPAFFEWLATVDCSRIKVYSLPGTTTAPATHLTRTRLMWLRGGGGGGAAAAA